MSKTTKAAAELAAVLAQEIAAGHGAADRRNPAPHLIASDVIDLQSIGRSIAARAVKRCNGVSRYSAQLRQVVSDWTDDDEARANAADERAAKRAGEIAALYGATVRVGGDPRGFTLRLILKSGRSNSFAGEGWGIT